MLFFLYNLYLLNMNWIGMITDGTQIVNLRVSSMKQRKQSQVYRTLWQSEERAKIGCSYTRHLSVNLLRIGHTESRHLVSA